MEKKRTDFSTRALVADAVGDLKLQRCFLVVVEGPEPGKAYLLEGSRTLVGKSSSCDIVVPDVTVSRQHFEVVADSGRSLIRDLNSTNGIILDGAMVKEAYLRPGSLVKAGEVTFRFQTDYDTVHLPPVETEAFGGLLGRSLRMREIFAMLERIAPSDATVLLLGETGSGKGAAVAALHQHSKRGKGPLVVVDCGAVARNLIESELFGHVRGAFTGATNLRKGALEASEGGTLFLDELDDLPLDLQPKLLRAIEERVFVRLGSNQPQGFDCRLVAATKKDLRKEMALGRFREDLYFRLSVVTIRLPPLRERPEDIPLLFDHFTGSDGPKFEGISQEMQTRWLGHSWPGNVRELRNAVERSRAFSLDGLVLGAQERISSPGATLAAEAGSIVPDYLLAYKEAKEKVLEVFEREYVKRLLSRSSGGVAGAARLAGIDRKHLYTLMEKHSLGKQDSKQKEPDEDVPREQKDE